tara:strand:- start:1063 stop:1296 length:234 start_codon:yes stop_codon:yes gene_type:complete
MLGGISKRDIIGSMQYGTLVHWYFEPENGGASDSKIVAEDYVGQHPKVVFAYRKMMHSVSLNQGCKMITGTYEDSIA